MDKENELVDSPLIIKPPISSGSDNVFHIPAKGDWKKVFNQVLADPSIGLWTITIPYRTEISDVF